MTKIITMLQHKQRFSAAYGYIFRVVYAIRHSCEHDACMLVRGDATVFSYAYALVCC